MSVVNVMKRQFDPFAFVSRHVLAIVFALYSAIFIGIVAIEMPPYQNPDEMNHFLRADQISRLGLLPQHLPTGVGGAFVDTAIIDTAVPFLTIPFHPERKVTSSLYESTSSVRWSGQLAQVAFPNTAIYPPTLYLPAVLGIWLGKITGSPVLRTLYLSRIANGICATIIATLAIALAEGAALWLFAVLTLPMSLALFSAVSQDGVMIACAALATSIVAKARHAKLPVSDLRFVVLVLALIAICMAKPPYIPLAGLVLVAPWRSPRLRAASLVLVAAATVSWSVLVLHTSGIDVTASQSDPKRQLYGMLQHPFRILAVLGNTYHAYWRDYREQIVGRLGWLDLALPAFIHVAAWTVLLLAATLSTSQAIHRTSLSAKALIGTLSCMAACVFLIEMIQYLTFSSVSSPTIQGVQGRYFLEVIMILPVCIYGSQPARNYGKYANIAVVLTAATYIPFVARAILYRYYL